jgi:hypothetical protein
LGIYAIGVTVSSGNVIIESFGQGTSTTIPIVASGGTAIAFVIVMIKNVKNAIAQSIAEEGIAFLIRQIIFIIVKEV